MMETNKQIGKSLGNLLKGLKILGWGYKTLIYFKMRGPTAEIRLTYIFMRTIIHVHVLQIYFFQIVSVSVYR